QGVFGVVGVTVFAFAPLGNVVGQTQAHDGCPAGFTVSLAREPLNEILSLVPQAKRMTQFMRTGLGAGFATHIKAPARSVTGPVEGSHIANARVIRDGKAAWCDNNPLPAALRRMLKNA